MTPKSGRLVTLKDIAGEVGVSVTAVSMALRDHPRLSKATRERIKETARELGYVPNPMVSALMSQVSRGRVINQGVVIGLLVDHRCFHRSSSNGTDDYLEIIIEGLVERLKVLGCKYEEFPLPESPRQQRRINQILQARGITGLLLPSVYSVGTVPEIDYNRTTVVTSGYSLANLPIHRVVPDEFLAMNLGLLELLRRGYQKPALYTHSHIDRRINGFSVAAYVAGCYRYFPKLRNRPIVLCEDKWSKSSLKKMIEIRRPDVIISNYDEIAQWLAELGMRVPEDIGFLRLGLRGPAAQAHTNLNGRILGSWMVDLLTSSLNRNETGLPAVPKRLVVPPVFVDGNSLRPADTVDAGSGK